MARDDAYVERYSRQIILAEVGPRGQERLAAARVAIAACGPAAERVVAYLAAAGVGTLALAPALRALVDPDQSDVRVEELAAGAAAARGATRLDAAPQNAMPSPDASAEFDAVVVDATLSGAAAVATDRVGAAADDTTAPTGRRRFWIAAGRAAEMPPCDACAAAVLGAVAPVPPPLATLRDAVLGTVVATEIVKAILEIGTPLTGRVLAYDPETASLTTTAVAARPECPCRGSTATTNVSVENQDELSR